MTPTIKELKRVAKSCGAVYIAQNASPYQFTIKELQAFAQHWIEVGRKMQREKDANLCTSTYKDRLGIERNFFDIPSDYAEAIRNNTGE